ncbi:phosphoenolpyruvate carboxykinase (ATP), partial [bacterium]|nr:phosphoenolpyruvate carboxykinase (ATP) [bacterium]
MVYWNLPGEALYEEIAFRREARIVAGGPVVAHTGKHTGRAANDKAVVREPST